MSRIKYKELSSRKFKPNRNVVISEGYNQDGSFRGYSIAEQMTFLEDGRETPTKVFMSGGLGFVDIDGLLALKKAVDEACSQVTLQAENK